jgi:hypothetical protein
MQRRCLCGWVCIVPTVVGCDAELGGSYIHTYMYACVRLTRLHTHLSIGGGIAVPWGCMGEAALLTSDACGFIRVYMNVEIRALEAILVTPMEVCV